MPMDRLLAEDMYMTYAQRGDGIGFFGADPSADGVKDDRRCGLYEWLTNASVTLSDNKTTMCGEVREKV